MKKCKLIFVLPIALLFFIVAFPAATVSASDDYEILPDEWISLDEWVRDVVGNPENVVQTVAGTGSHGAIDGASAQFNLPIGIFGRVGGGLYVADTNNNLIRRIDTYGYTHRVAGDILTLDEHNFPHGFYRDADASNALFNRPAAIVSDGGGMVFIADSENNAIRVISGGNVYTFAGGGQYGHADGDMSGASFNHPGAIAIGPDGSIYVADTRNHTIRRIDQNGNVTTIAGVPGTYGYRDGESDQALFRYPMGIAVSEDGMIFVADTGNHVIRVIEYDYVWTLAGSVMFPRDVAWVQPGDFDEVPLGGFADGYWAMFNMPMGIALWGDVLIVADRANHMIRAVCLSGATATLAGTGYAGHADGLLFEAELHLPSGVYVRDNTIYIADTGNNLIRKFRIW